MDFLRREGAQVSEDLGPWPGLPPGIEVSFQGSEPLCVPACFILLFLSLPFSRAWQPRQDLT